MRSDRGRRGKVNAGAMLAEAIRRFRLDPGSEVVATHLDDPKIGSVLRRLRQQRGWTLRELSRRSGLSVAFISEVERDLVSPSVASLSRLTGALGVRIGDLFERPTSSDRLVRAVDRRMITYGEENPYWDEVLSPSLSGKLLVLRSTILPGADSGGAYAHEAEEECVVLLEGTLEITVHDEVYRLAEGDALTFPSRLPHGWRNDGDRPAVALWVITPPTF
jgi:transcriptional regulator with XRE-family HTH domain